MADNIETPVATTEVAPVTTPLADQTVTPVVTSVEVSPQVTPVTEASVTPVVEPAKIEAPVTVLGEALETPIIPEIKTEVTVEETPVAEVKEGSTEPKETEGGQSEETAPPPKYDPFTLPEGLSLQEEKVGKFTELLSELELGGKVPHELVQQFGQKAVDFHVNEVKQAVEDITKAYQASWESTKTEWKNQFLADPEMGGNRFQTTVDSALTFIRTHGGSPEQQAEFKGLMESSGLGNHPAMIRLLANAGVAMSEGKPLAAVKPVSAPKSRVSTMYGAKSNQ